MTQDQAEQLLAKALAEATDSKKTKQDRLAWWEYAKRIHASRSPEMVAKMEKEKGLA